MMRTQRDGGLLVDTEQMSLVAVISMFALFVACAALPDEPAKQVKTAEPQIIQASADAN